MEEFISRRIVDRNTFKFKMLLWIELVDEFYCFGKNRKCGEPQEVKLHKANIFHVLLIELTDSVFGTPVGVVERAEIRELPWCNQHAAGVHTEVPCQAFQRFGKSNDFFIFVIAFNCLFEFRHLGNCIVERNVPPRLHGDKLRERIRLHVWDV